MAVETPARESQRSGIVHSSVFDPFSVLGDFAPQTTSASQPASSASLLFSPLALTAFREDPPAVTSQSISPFQSLFSPSQSSSSESVSGVHSRTLLRGTPVPVWTCSRNVFICACCSSWSSKHSGKTRTNWSRK